MKRAWVLLETGRLVLRRFTEDDAQNLFDLDSDPEVMRYLNGGTPTPRGVIEADILPRFSRYDERSPCFGVWAADERATGEFIGWFSFRPLDDSDPVEVALGFRLRRSSWGQGYATEGARALIHLGFGELGVQRVVATTYEDNLASRRVMEKAGMGFAQTFGMTREELARVDTYDVGAQDLWDGNDVEYALLRSDWEAQEGQ
jgi:RimJ/RimL family protein N-acetyltransferase